MRLALLCWLYFLFITGINCQITITGDDMPKPGDTVRTSITPFLEGLDYETTGEDYTWDFSALTVMAQQVDTFVGVSETPLLYQAVFNNQFIFPDHKASVAKKLTEFDLIPELEVTDTYQFFKEADGEYREVGVGVTLQQVPLPIAYQEIDTLYRFPLEYGDSDSSTALLSIEVPGLGYLEVDRKRKNTVDGWGTLVTPFGEFQTIRVKTEVIEYDSIYIDSLNTGFPVNREFVEYKWLTNGISLPVLRITEEGLALMATYVDTLRTSFLGMDDNIETLDFNFNVYPNPSSDFISVSYELTGLAHVKISFYSFMGKEVRRVMGKQQARGLYNRLINLKEAGLSPGLYLLVLQVDSQTRVKRIMVQ